MKTKRSLPGVALVLSVIALLTGCGKSQEDSVGGALPRNPKEAASQIEQAFTQAPAEIKQAAGVASTALRGGDYEKAVVSLMTVRSSDKLTLEQGLAVHRSMVAMEGRLIRAIEAGDKNAERAYQLLKQLKRN